VAVRAVLGDAGLDVVSSSLMAPLVEYGGEGTFWTGSTINGNVWGSDHRIFDALGTRFLAGRAFSEIEVIRGEPVVVLSAAAARALWPSEPISSTIGKSVPTPTVPHTVVGVVPDLLAHPGAQVLPAAFLPIGSDLVAESKTSLTLLLRMREGATVSEKQLIARLNDAFAPSSAQLTMVSERMQVWLVRPRFVALLLGTLALVTLSLVACGLLAIASTQASKSRYEMTLRMVFGASAAEVRRRFTVAVLIPVCLGAVFGLTVVWATVRSFSILAAVVDSIGVGAVAVSVVVILLLSAATAIFCARRLKHLELVTALKSL
jgi:hypothetical protein